MNKFKSGFVAILGRPNVGKSTFLNYVLGKKVSIISPKPQTTRNRLQGIYTTDDMQIIFIDTPGIHKPQNKLGDFMNNEAFSTLNDADVVMLLTDSTQEFGTGDKFVLDLLKKSNAPKVLVCNKMDLVKKNITSENYILNELKKVTSNEKLIQELLNYEKNYNQSRKIRALLKDSEVKNIVDLLIDLKKDLKQTTGSIKYQYLMKYPDIINKLNNISNTIIDSSVQCKIEIEKYIKAKQKLEEFKYSNKEKLEQAMAKAKEEAQEEVIKLIGNQILDIERKWLNTSEPYTYIKYNNDSRDLTDRILTALYFLTENQNKLNRNYELNYKKQLSKQAKKELARSKRNASSFEWEDEI